PWGDTAAKVVKALTAATSDPGWVRTSSKETATTSSHSSEPNHSATIPRSASLPSYDHSLQRSKFRTSSAYRLTKASTSLALTAAAYASSISSIGSPFVGIVFTTAEPEETHRRAPFAPRA